MRLWLLLHLFEMLGLFSAIGIDWFSTRHLRRAETLPQVRLWVTVMRPLAWWYTGSEVLLLGSGGILLARHGSWFTAWVFLAFGATVVLAAPRHSASTGHVG